MDDGRWKMDDGRWMMNDGMKLCDFSASFALKFLTMLPACKCRDSDQITFY